MNRIIKLAGKELSLRYTFESLCLMRERFNVNALNPDVFDPDPRTLSVMIWGGLVDSNDKLTLGEVQRGLDLKDMRAANQSVADALLADLPGNAAEGTSN